MGEKYLSTWEETDLVHVNQRAGKYVWAHAEGTEEALSRYLLNQWKWN